MISDVRPMRQLLAIVAATALLVGCSPPSAAPSVEDFLVAFERMQKDQSFLEERTLPELMATEEFAEDGVAAAASRRIPCSTSAMHRGGWDVLPDSADLAQSDARYIVEKATNDDTKSVVLGVPGGVADARYFFQRLGGKWYLSKMDIYSYTPPGATRSPLPCKPEA
nr:putative integron gene cassette protein [uncultured bacterium]